MKNQTKKGPMFAAWKKGYQAYLDGKTIDENPHRGASMMGWRWFLSWREGWNDAKSSDEKN